VGVRVGVAKVVLLNTSRYGYKTDTNKKDQNIFRNRFGRFVCVGVGVAKSCFGI